MPFLPPNQQRQSTKGNTANIVGLYPHDGADPDDFVVQNLLGDGDPGDVSAATEVHVAAQLVLDVLYHLRQYGFGVRHALADLAHPVRVVFLAVDLPRAVTARRPADLKQF